MKPLLLLLSTLLLSLPLLSSFAADEAEQSLSSGKRVFEMRTYYAHPGKLQALHARFRDHTNGLFVKHGMSLVGYWVPKDKEDTLVYILAYPSQEARDQSWKGFFADPAWKAAYEASIKDGKLVKKVDQQFLSATDYSPIQ